MPCVCAAGGGSTVPTDMQRWAGRVGRSRLGSQPADRPPLKGDGGGLLCPQGGQGVEHLVGTRSSRVERDPEGRELRYEVSRADPEQHAPTGHSVQRGDLFGQRQGLIEREHRHARTQEQGRRLRRDSGQRDEGLEDRGVRGDRGSGNGRVRQGEVLTCPDALPAGRFRRASHLDGPLRILTEGTHVDPEQPQLHALNRSCAGCHQGCLS